MRNSMKRAFSTFLGMLFLVFFASAAFFAQQTPNPFVDELKSSNADVRAKAVHHLGDSGDASVVPALTAELNDPSAKVRKEVIIALAKLHTAPALNGLLVATKDTDPDVRTLAVRTVVGWYTGNIPSLGYRGALSWFQTDTMHINPGVRVDPQVVTALIAVMEDARSIDAAREAAHGLGVLLARSAVPQLIKAAHSPDADLAANALNSLSKIKEISAGPQLVDLLDSPDKEVRQTACVTV